MRVYVVFGDCHIRLDATSNGRVAMQDETWKMIVALTTHFPSRRDKTARFHRACTSRATSSAPSFPVSFLISAGRNRKIHESSYVICHVRSGFAHSTQTRDEISACYAHRNTHDPPVAETPNELFRSRARSPELFRLQRFIVVDRCILRRDLRLRF